MNIKLVLFGIIPLELYFSIGMQRILYHFTRIAFLASVLVWSLDLSAQTYLLESDSSSVMITGGSTLKDWSVEVGSMRGHCVIDGDSVQVDSAFLAFETKTFEGGRGPDMNAKINKALDATNHPEIQFAGSSFEVVESLENSIKLAATGDLMIAGKTRKATVILAGTLSPLRLNATHQLKFSDFEIEPPSALFGQIKCDDEMVINFDLSFAENHE